MTQNSNSHGHNVRGSSAPDSELALQKGNWLKEDSFASPMDQTSLLMPSPKDSPLRVSFSPESKHIRGEYSCVPSFRHCTLANTLQPAAKAPYGRAPREHSHPCHPRGNHSGGGPRQMRAYPADVLQDTGEPAVFISAWIFCFDEGQDRQKIYCFRVLSGVVFVNSAQSDLHDSPGSHTEAHATLVVFYVVCAWRPSANPWLCPTAKWEGRSTAFAIHLICQLQSIHRKGTFSSH